jgi:hypothetical protein
MTLPVVLDADGARRIRGSVAPQRVPCAPARGTRPRSGRAGTRGRVCRGVPWTGSDPPGRDGPRVPPPDSGSASACRGCRHRLRACPPGWRVAVRGRVGRSRGRARRCHLRSPGGGLVITSDPDDIARLAVAVPAARVVTRPAEPVDGDLLRGAKSRRCPTSTSRMTMCSTPRWPRSAATRISCLVWPGATCRIPRYAGLTRTAEIYGSCWLVPPS